MEDPPVPQRRSYSPLSPAELDRMAAKWLKAHGHLRMKEPVVSREKAFELATDVAETIGRTVREVRELADLNFQGIRTPCVYNLDLTDCWIAYLASLNRGPRSSDIVVIDKTTGAVRYSGSAHDEG